MGNLNWSSYSLLVAVRGEVDVWWSECLLQNNIRTGNHQKKASLVGALCNPQPVLVTEAALQGSKQ